MGRMAVFISRVDLSGEHAVTIKTAFHRGRGTLLSLSDRGVYIATDMCILPQATVRLQFVLPGQGKAVEAEAVVHWDNQGSSPNGDFPCGYGMRLTKVPRETAHAIREIMKSAIVPPSPDPEPEGESSFTIAPGSRSLPAKPR